MSDYVFKLKIFDVSKSIPKDGTIVDNKRISDKHEDVLFSFNKNVNENDLKNMYDATIKNKLFATRII